jgi:branched-chain amino acid transport system ATP-binding protein
MLLELDRLTIGYRGAGLGAADVSLSMADGEVLSLVGPNGAGKTSTLRGVSGMLRRETVERRSGNVLFCGKDITELSPQRRSALGIAYVPERDKIFSGLSGADNLRLGGLTKGSVPSDRVEQILTAFPDLRAHLDRPAGYLSGGQRQMLAIGAALCSDPRLLVVDEVTLGLSPQTIRSLAASLGVLVEWGLSILMADQNVELAMELSDRLIVFEGGRLRSSGSPRELQRRGELRSVFLGSA